MRVRLLVLLWPCGGLELFADLVIDSMSLGEDSHATKSVIFVPLSPKSSVTLKRHHQDQLEAAAKEEREKQEEEELDKLLALVPARQRSIPHSHQQRSISPYSSSDDSSPRRSERRRQKLSRTNDEVEILPDRFDRHGRRLDGGQTRADGQWTSREGEFERRPRHRGDWEAKGAWQVAGTDRETIDGVVRGVTSALEGRRGWLGMLGNVLAEMHGSETNNAIEDGGDRYGRHGHRHRRLTN